MAIANLADLFDVRATQRPDHPQYRIVGRDETSTLSLQSLRDTVGSVATALDAECAPHSSVILLTPSPGAFLAGFFGACLADMVPVPVAPPGRSRLERGLAPLRAIVDDCKPAMILTTRRLRDRITDFVYPDDPLRSFAWEAIEDVATRPARTLAPSAAEADDLAYLQYTSGSTSSPKGVEVTQGAVLANLANIDAAFENRPTDHGMIWLPSHHDMGLLGGILAPLFSKMTVTLATPQQFLQSPIRWLKWISDEGATISGGPDFAYRLCVDRIRDDQMEGLDLSRWRLAFTGAEPIRADTLDAFAQRFAEVGFRREAFYPCYGLAEATLMVTGGRAADPPRVMRTSRTALYQREVAPPQSADDVRTLVACGNGISAEDQIAIVDPDTHRAVRDDTVGEIWYSGPSAGAGYHGRAETSAQMFSARLAGRDGTWLRTGDLGFIHDGELFVTGRRRDTIVIRGRNLDAADIDEAIQSSVSVARLGTVAALNPIGVSGERLVIAIEAGRSAVVEAENLVNEVQVELAARFGIRAHEVVLVRTGSLPRTTSGKLKRAAATQACELGTLALLAPMVGDDNP